MHIAYHESRTVRAKKNLLLSLTLEQWHKISLNIDSSQSRAAFVPSSVHHLITNVRIWSELLSEKDQSWECTRHLWPPQRSFVPRYASWDPREREEEQASRIYVAQWGQIMYEVELELFYIIYEICSSFSILAILRRYVIRKHLAESKRYENWNTTSFIFLSPLLCIRGSNSPVCMYPADMRWLDFF